MSVAERIASVVPAGTRLTPAETDAVIEIAYLAIAADRRLGDDELTAFRALTERLKGRPISRADLNRLLDDMSEQAESARSYDGKRPYANARLSALAKPMSTGARELAYRVAYAMGLADMAASEEEWELDVELGEALQISDERAEELEAAVMDALNPPE